MKKVNEIINPLNSFFTAFKAKEPDVYFEFFEEADPLEMDADLLVCVGNRYAAPLISFHDMPFAVNWLLRRYKDSWLKMKDALTADYDLLKPMTNRQVTTVDSTGTREDSSTGTQQDGVHGADSVTAVPTDVSQSSDSGTQATTGHSVTTVETAGNAGQFTAQKLLLDELELRKKSFIDYLIREIGNNMTLDIY